jgi:hypothetical protein
MGPPPNKNNDKLKEPLPKSIKEVPRFLKNIIGKFVYRLFYIVLLVWETKPWILFSMVFMSIFNGAMPVIQAFVSSNLINGLADAYSAHQLGQTFAFHNTDTTGAVVLDTGHVAQGGDKDAVGFGNFQNGLALLADAFLTIDSNLDFTHL